MRMLFFKKCLNSRKIYLFRFSAASLSVQFLDCILLLILDEVIHYSSFVQETIICNSLFQVALFLSTKQMHIRINTQLYLSLQIGTDIFDKTKFIFNFFLI